jgi:serine/threonine protein kinase
VYLALDKTRQTLVAVKGHHVDVRNKWAFRSFEREMQILGTIRHPMLLNLHGCTCFEQEDDQNPCILIPFMSGGSVDEMIHAEQARGRAEHWLVMNGEICRWPWDQAQTRQGVA